MVFKSFPYAFLAYVFAISRQYTITSTGVQALKQEPWRGGIEKAELAEALVYRHVKNRWARIRHSIILLAKTTKATWDTEVLEGEGECDDDFY